MEKRIAKKYNGIVLDKRRNKWRATIKIKGITKYLGEYVLYQDAVNARIEAEKNYKEPLLLEKQKIEKEICALYLSGKHQCEIGTILSKDQSTISNILHKHNIQIRNNKNLDENKIIKLYKNNTIQQIAKKLNVGHGTIRKRLIKNKIKIRPNRKYFFDESIFEKIDCEWKAYYLGYFYADAGITKLNVKLSLHEKDKEILEKLNTLVFKNQHPLEYTPHKIYYSKKTNKLYNNNAKYSIIINSKKLVNDLNKLGCGPKKSLTLQFPTYDEVSDEYMSHFIRGYFDGDGCIIKGTFQIISSDDFCNGLQRYIYDKLNIQSHLHKCGKVSRLFIHKKDDILKFKNYMYNNSNFKLSRKFTKFITLGYV